MRSHALQSGNGYSFYTPIVIITGGHLWSVPPVAPVVMHIQPFGLCVTITANPDEKISTMLKKK